MMRKYKQYDRWRFFMNKAEFNRLSRERVLYLDGATGSNLIKLGIERS